eukprot:CAMPEP_0185735936 /NCGR_PEP_ID=MMETSP1171-20130828/26497_1 /TAXON_ID=374046 /ORGANISM="Helicotheca tamensis, Strain CCMP826" /LENGTH=55 /DNA_ID=CAMNT_0028406391 /DNA_START=59 /DNA_END=226 /DNA_ORIENTATION=+
MTTSKTRNKETRPLLHWQQHITTTFYVESPSFLISPTPHSDNYNPTFALRCKTSG